ncbi:uncharacterized protein PG998_012761 [Apiospora kogelbergensis]|uniref:uncharacterized protein n=1 Tax=Apiospora kogelbergensis TaxID=1337665 RepID=UPI00312DABCE
MPRFTVNEPHPTVAKDSFTHSGRGGAGNFFRAPETTPATGIATAPITTAPRPSGPGRFYSGRGGAGNAHASAQRPVMCLEESYQLQSHIEAKAVGYVGRGGAGNAFVKGAAAGQQRKGSDASSVASSRSSGSVRSNLLERISGSLRRNS